MTTRKQTTSVKKRARSRPARPRPAAARKSGSRCAALAVGAECTVAGADALKESLERLVDEPQPVTLDVSAVQRIDTAALQLLAAFVRDRRTGGRAIEWRGQAPALESAARLLGLQGMLELPGENG